MFGGQVVSHVWVDGAIELVLTLMVKFGRWGCSSVDRAVVS